MLLHEILLLKPDLLEPKRPDGVTELRVLLNKVGLIVSAFLILGMLIVLFYSASVLYVLNQQLLEKLTKPDNSSCSLPNLRVGCTNDLPFRSPVDILRNGIVTIGNQREAVYLISAWDDMHFVYLVCLRFSETAKVIGDARSDIGVSSMTRHVDSAPNCQKDLYRK